MERPFASPPRAAPEAEASLATVPAPREAARPAAARRLDWRGLEPPKQLAEARLEDLTIDGICGVY